MKKHITVPFFIPHAGCPHTCIFCNQRHISGHRNMPEPGEIEASVHAYSASAPQECVIEIGFFGGTFTAIPLEQQEAYLSRALKLKQKGVISSIRLSTRPDACGNTILDLLEEYSVDTVELGVQSFHNDILSAAHRGHTAEDVYDAHRRLKKRGFATGIQLMPGLPGDSHHRSVESAEIAVSLHPDCARIYPTVVIKDTCLHTMYREGRYIPLSLEEAVDVGASMTSLYNQNNITVIRLGLHPLDDEEKDSIVAGPYHTAYGFLVKSRIKRNIIDTRLADHFRHTSPSSLILTFPEKCYEEYIGSGKENIKFLEKKYNTTISYQRGPVLDVMNT